MIENDRYCFQHLTWSKRAIQNADSRNDFFIQLIACSVDETPCRRRKHFLRATQGHHINRRSL